MTEHLEMIAYMQRALDGDLDAAARRLLDAHLESCAVCAHDWNALQAVHRQLISSPRLKAESGFTERVLARIAAEQRRERARRADVFRLVFAAMILGAFSAVLLLAPLAGLASPDMWAGFMSDALAFFAAAAAWLAILMTLLRVALLAVGDGPLLAGLIVALGLTLMWVRLVAGAEGFKRPAYVNGGIR
jgi:anti-sigma factor RsiW